MINVSDRSCGEHQNRHLMFNNTFKKSCHLWDAVEKNGTVRQATDDHMVHVPCILDD